MSAITERVPSLLDLMRQRHHPFCAVCGRHGSGLGLSFRLLADRSVETEFDCRSEHQGYQGILHGGITASILDGAMIHCLFAHGLVAVPAEMDLQFRHPVEVGKSLLARARIQSSRPPLHVVEGELVQDGQIRAKAVGRFMEKPDRPKPG